MFYPGQKAIGEYPTNTLSEVLTLLNWYSRRLLISILEIEGRQIRRLLVESLEIALELRLGEEECFRTEG